MNRITRILLFSLLCIGIPEKTFSQFEGDISQFQQITFSANNKEDSKKIKQNVKEYAEEHTGTMQIIFAHMFLFYKNFLSSQDVSSCPFSLSCSEFFILSVQKNGVVLGFLDGIDRFLRCNGYSNDMYDVDPKTNKLIDPVYDIKLKLN